MKLHNLTSLTREVAIRSGLRPHLYGSQRRYGAKPCLQQVALNYFCCCLNIIISKSVRGKSRRRFFFKPRRPPAHYEPPGRSSRVYLPECQQPPVKVRSKEAPDRPPMREGRAWRQHLIFIESRLDARWQQEVWPRHENKSRERCGSRASSPHLRFFHGVA